MPWHHLESNVKEYIANFFFSTLSADARILKAKVAHFLLLSNDPPLDLKAPKPLFAKARNGSTFGFQSRVSATVSQLLKMAVLEMDDWDSAQNGEDGSVDADGIDIDEDLAWVWSQFIIVLSTYSYFLEPVANIQDQEGNLGLLACKIHLMTY